jgi:hypothetical protein
MGMAKMSKTTGKNAFLSDSLPYTNISEPDSKTKAERAAIEA